MLNKIIVLILLGVLVTGMTEKELDACLKPKEAVGMKFETCTSDACKSD